MSPDTIVSAALLLTALLLMMRPGCGPRVSRIHDRKTTGSQQPGDAGAKSTN